MNWYGILKQSQNQVIYGYKIVYTKDGRTFASIYDHSPVDGTIGSVVNKGGAGLYLGTTKQFCTDYYSGGTNYQDALLTYAVNPQDVIKGDPHHPNAEFQVRQAKLVNVELLPKEDEDGGT